MTRKNSQHAKKNNDRDLANFRYRMSGYVVITLLWCGVSGLFVGYSVITFYKTYKAAAFATTKGVVISSELDIDSDHDKTTYRPSVKYRYTVDGKEYTSSQWSYGGKTGSDSSAYAQEVVGRYKPGKPVKVYYDPETPSDAVLSIKVESESCFWGVITQPLAFIGLGLIFYTAAYPRWYSTVRSFLGKPTKFPWKIPSWGVATSTPDGLAIKRNFPAARMIVHFLKCYSIACLIFMCTRIVFAFLGMSGQEAAAWILSVSAAIAVLMTISWLFAMRPATLTIDKKNRVITLKSPRRCDEIPFSDIQLVQVRYFPSPKLFRLRFGNRIPVLTVVLNNEKLVPLHYFMSLEFNEQIAVKVGKELAEYIGKPFSKCMRNAGKDIEFTAKKYDFVGIAKFLRAGSRRWWKYADIT